MYGIVDRLLVFSCCFAVMIWRSNDAYSVLVVLAAITVSSLNGLHRSGQILRLCVLLYCGAALVWGELTLFLPLVIYDLLAMDHRRLGRGWFVAVLAPAVVTLVKLPMALSLVMFLIMVIGYVLSQRGAAVVQSRGEMKSLRDDGWELTVLLQEKNKELVEKQDYGVRMARLGERSRIAREIHDHVGHLLSRSILQVGAVLVSAEDEQTRASLSTLKDTLFHAMDRIRASVHGLYEESLDLRTQVDALVRDFDFCSIRLDYKLEQSPGKDIENCFVAIMKEGLNNVVRHSNATHVTLAFLEHPALYQLVIQDNGTQVDSGRGAGLGLRSMTDRVEALGGRFLVEYEGGFRLFISIPKRRALHESVNH